MSRTSSINSLRERSQGPRLESPLPESYWEFALETAIQLHNRRNWTTPFELWHGHKPDVSYLRIFGCAAYVFIPQNQRQNKLSPPSELMIFIGYEGGSKAYCFMRFQKGNSYMLALGLAMFYMTHQLNLHPLVVTFLRRLESLVPQILQVQYHRRTPQGESRRLLNLYSLLLDLNINVFSRGVKISLWLKKKRWSLKEKSHLQRPLLEFVKLEQGYDPVCPGNVRGDRHVPVNITRNLLQDDTFPGATRSTGVARLAQMFKDPLNLPENLEYEWIDGACQEEPRIEKQIKIAGFSM